MTLSLHDIANLRALFEDIFDEWYPDVDPGERLYLPPPPHIEREAFELGQRHIQSANKRRQALYS